MTVKDAVKGTILKLESMCDSYKKSPIVELVDLEKTVSNLSEEVQNLDLASDQTLKTELSSLQGALQRLSTILKSQQENLDRQVQEIHLHQRALNAYSKVANNNLGSLA